MARELFRARGYAGASMQDIADRVGLRKASLYSRFPDKEALVGEVLRLTLDETFAAVNDTAGWRANYEAVLRSMSGALLDRGRCVGLHLAYGVSAETPLALAAVRGFFTTCRRRLAGALSAVAEPAEADRLAVDALSRLEGATLWLAIDGDAVPMRSTLDRLLAEADELGARNPGRVGSGGRGSARSMRRAPEPPPAVADEEAR